MPSSKQLDSEWRDCIDGLDAMLDMTCGAQISRLKTRLTALEAVLEAARSANAHWNEFGPEYDFERAMDAVHKAIRAADATKETT